MHSLSLYFQQHCVAHNMVYKDDPLWQQVLKINHYYSPRLYSPFYFHLTILVCFPLISTVKQVRITFRRTFSLTQQPVSTSTNSGS